LSIPLGPKDVLTTSAKARQKLVYSKKRNKKTFSSGDVAGSDILLFFRLIEGLFCAAGRLLCGTRS